MFFFLTFHPTICTLESYHFKFAAEEAAKVDAVWSGIFGSADNSITIPEDDGSSNGGFFDMGDDELPDGEIMIGG